MQYKHEVNSGYTAVYTAGVNQDLPMLTEALAVASIDTAHGKKNTCPVKQLAIENNVNAVDFLLNQHACMVDALSGYAFSNTKQAFQLLNKIKKEEPHEIDLALYRLGEGFGLRDDPTEVFVLLKRIAYEYTASQIVCAVKGILNGLGQRHDNKTIDAFLETTKTVYQIKLSPRDILTERMVAYAVKGDFESAEKILESAITFVNFADLLSIFALYLGQLEHNPLALFDRTLPKLKTPAHQTRFIQLLAKGIGLSGNKTMAYALLDIVATKHNNIITAIVIAIGNGFVGGGHTQDAYAFLDLVEKNHRPSYTEVLKYMCTTFFRARNIDERNGFLRMIEEHPVHAQAKLFIWACFITELTQRSLMHATQFFDRIAEKMAHSPSKDSDYTYMLHHVFSLKNKAAIRFLIKKMNGMQPPLNLQYILGHLVTIFINRKQKQDEYYLLELLNQIDPQLGLPVLVRMIDAMLITNPAGEIIQCIDKIPVFNSLLISPIETLLAKKVSYDLKTLSAHARRFNLLMRENNLSYQELLAWEQPAVHIYLLQGIQLVIRGKLLLPLFLDIASYLIPGTDTTLSNFIKTVVTKYPRRYFENATLYERLFFPNQTRLENKLEEVKPILSAFDRIGYAAQHEDENTLKELDTTVSINVLHHKKFYPAIAKLAFEKNTAAVDCLLKHHGSWAYAAYGYALVDPNQAYDFIKRTKIERPEKLHGVVSHVALGLAQRADLSAIETFLPHILKNHPTKTFWIIHQIARGFGIQGNNPTTLDAFARLCKEYPEYSVTLLDWKVRGLIEGGNPDEALQLVESTRPHQLLSEQVLYQLACNGYLEKTFAQLKGHPPTILSPLLSAFVKAGLEDEFLARVEKEHPGEFPAVKCNLASALAKAGRKKEAYACVEQEQDSIQRHALVLSIAGSLAEGDHIYDVKQILQNFAPFCTRILLLEVIAVGLAKNANLGEILALWKADSNFSLVSSSAIIELVSQGFDEEAFSCLDILSNNCNENLWKSVAISYAKRNERDRNAFMDKVELNYPKHVFLVATTITTTLTKNCTMKEVGAWLCRAKALYPHETFLDLVQHSTINLVLTHRSTQLFILIREMSLDLPENMAISIWGPVFEILNSYHDGKALHQKLLQTFQSVYPAVAMQYMLKIANALDSSNLCIDESVALRTMALCRDEMQVLGFLPALRLSVKQHFNVNKTVSQALQFIRLRGQNNLSEEQLLGWMQPQLKIYLLQIGIALMQRGQLQPKFFMHIATFLLPDTTIERVSVIAKNYLVQMHRERFFKAPMLYTKLLTVEEQKGDGASEVTEPTLKRPKLG